MGPGQDVSDWREITAVTRKKALEEAVRLLGIAVSDMEIADLPDQGEGVRLLVRPQEAEGEEVPKNDVPDAEVSESVCDLEDDEDFDGDTDQSQDQEALIQEQQVVALDFLEELLEAFDLEGEISSEVRDNTVYVDVAGEELGALIGRRGATLSALSEICKTVIQRRTASRVRLQLDVKGYRARRRAALEIYATGLAEEVVKSGIEKALEPMSASDRKIVHDAVAQIEGVRSYSEGNEPKRSVVVTPV